LCRRSTLFRHGESVIRGFLQASGRAPSAAEAGFARTLAAWRESTAKICQKQAIFPSILLKTHMLSIQLRFRTQFFQVTYFQYLPGFQHKKRLYTKRYKSVIPAWRAGV
jgi:hypothetical protein